MCVGLSARVVKINENGTALVDASGAKRQISAQLLEDLEPGNYVMVHAGAAIAKITNDDISETEELLEELSGLSGDFAVLHLNFCIYASW